MVKRFHADFVNEDSQGGWVTHSDYLALQAALKEALEGWEKNWKTVALEYGEEGPPILQRIKELQKQFLDI